MGIYRILGEWLACGFQEPWLNPDCLADTVRLGGGLFFFKKRNSTIVILKFGPVMGIRKNNSRTQELFHVLGRVANIFSRLRSSEPKPSGLGRNHGRDPHLIEKFVERLAPV